MQANKINREAAEYINYLKSVARSAQYPCELQDIKVDKSMRGLVFIHVSFRNSLRDCFSVYVALKPKQYKGRRSSWTVSGLHQSGGGIICRKLEGRGNVSSWFRIIFHPVEVL